MTVHWPSFFLGLFMPSMVILTLFVLGGLFVDAVNWLNERQGPL